MTVYYCGPGGSDVAAGTSWATRKLTLAGLEAIPPAAGDTLWVGPGTYREMWTIGVSGTAGNPITRNGDYTGANTDGVGGVVRITGSNDDKSATRTNCITATSINYNTFSGFQFDTTTDNLVTLTTVTFFTFDKCHFGFHTTGRRAILCQGASQSNVTLQNCYFAAVPGQNTVAFFHSATVDNCSHLVQNCVFQGGVQPHVQSDKIGGITVKNCAFVQNGDVAVRVTTALTAGKKIIGWIAYRISVGSCLESVGMIVLCYLDLQFVE